jgi:hypothetical protein
MPVKYEALVEWQLVSNAEVTSNTLFKTNQTLIPSDWTQASATRPANYILIFNQTCGHSEITNNNQMNDLFEVTIAWMIIQTKLLHHLVCLLTIQMTSNNASCLFDPRISLTEVLSQYLPVGVRKSRKTPSQDSWYPSKSWNQAPPNICLEHYHYTNPPSVLMWLKSHTIDIIKGKNAPDTTQWQVKVLQSALCWNVANVIMHNILL